MWEGAKCSSESWCAAVRRGKGLYQVAVSGLSSFPGKTTYTLSRGKGHCGGLCK